MHPTVNHLVQLQELTLIREEQRLAHGGEHLEKLNESIDTMTEQLPPDVRVMFGKLRKKDQNAIVVVSKSNCSGCGMQLPRSLVQQVKMAKEIQSCPNCARYLYSPDEVVRNVRKQPGRFELRKPGISRFSSENLMVTNLDAKSGEDAIKELATLMEKEGFVDRSDFLIEEALRREAICSTAVDLGLAFPHVRGVEGGGLTLAVGLSEKGFIFDGAKDGELTHTVFFLVIPTAASAFYLKLLAGLTETFTDEAARAALAGVKDQADMWKTLLKVTRKAIK
jgi:mannitol/fructose-specific phosphotransferase system IIA component (Ntr-type)